jgi:hypothetical protein
VNQDKLKEESSPSIAEGTMEAIAATGETMEPVEANDEAVVTANESVDGASEKTSGEALWIVIGCGILCVAAGCGVYFYKKKKKA